MQPHVPAGTPLVSAVPQRLCKLIFPKGWFPADGSDNQENQSSKETCLLVSWFLSYLFVGTVTQKNF